MFVNKFNLPFFGEIILEKSDRQFKEEKIKLGSNEFFLTISLDEHLKLDGIGMSS